MAMRRLYEKYCPACGKKQTGRKEGSWRIWWTVCECRRVPGPHDVPRLVSIRDIVDNRKEHEVKDLYNKACPHCYRNIPMIDLQSVSAGAQHKCPHCGKLFVIGELSQLVPVPELQTLREDSPIKLQVYGEAEEGPRKRIVRLKLVADGRYINLVVCDEDGAFEVGGVLLSIYPEGIYHISGVEPKIGFALKDGRIVSLIESPKG